MSVAEVVVESRLAASPERVWEHAGAIAGVNDELGGLLRMTAPAGARIDGPDVPLGRRWFRSWLLLGGVLPVEYYDDLTLVRVEPGRGFLERSSAPTVRVWERERTLEPLADGGTRVRDRVRAEPRLPVPAAVPRALIAAIFRLRHRRLRRRFA